MPRTAIRQNLRVQDAVTDEGVRQLRARMDANRRAGRSTTSFTPMVNKGAGKAPGKGAGAKKPPKVRKAGAAYK